MKYIFSIIFVFCIYIFYKGLQKDPHLIPSNLISKSIPEFSVESLKGSDLSHLDLMTKDVVILNFFASWCPPCKVEHPQLLKISEEILVYGIAKKNKENDLVLWLEKLGSPYKKIGMDHDGLLSINWGVYGLPETFIISEGLVKYRHLGPIMDKDLEIFYNITKSLK